MKLKTYFWATLALTLLSGARSPLFAGDSNGLKWTSTGTLVNARQYHSATFLPSGRVLFVGGYGSSGELSTVELYDPVAGAFTRASDLAHGRSNHTATLLLNGEVLVVGGQSGGNTLTSAEVYNPATDRWTPTGKLHIARSYHTATLLSDGEVLVTGGTHWASPPVFSIGAPPGSALDVAELYDPATGKWTVTDSMHTPRYAHTATLLSNGDVLVTGGIGSKKGGPTLPREALRELEESASMPAGRMFSDAVDSAELFDHKTRTWSVTGNLLCPVYNQTATLLSSGQVLVAGGQANGIQTDVAQIYSISSGKWTATGSLRAPRNGHTATLLTDGHVLVTGGANNSGVLSTAELFNPSAGTWETAPSMITPHCLHTATLLTNGKLLIAAGGYALGAPNFDQGESELCDFTEQPLADNGSSGSENPAPPPPSPPPNAQVAFAPPPPWSPLLASAGNLVVVTLCIVIITGCVVALSAVWLVFVVVQRWRK